MDIYINNEQSTLNIASKQVNGIVSSVLALENQRCDEVSINFVDKIKISELHELYFDDPSPTDCISFPIDKDEEAAYRVLGEIFICPEVALEYAVENRQNPFDETTLYIVHGLLHLLGYDDIKEEDLKKMREAERRHMDHLKRIKMTLKEEI